MLLKFLIQKSKRQIILPFYHLVTDTNPNFIKHLYTPKKIIKFKEDLELLLNYYNPISLEELISINKREKQITKPAFHLTFDDGLSNFYSTIAPILIDKAITATIFLNTDFVDNKNLFYRYKVSLLIEHYYNSDKNIKSKYIDFVLEKRDKRIENREKRKENRDKTIDDDAIISFLLGITFKNRNVLDDLAKKVNYSFADFLAKEKPYLTISQIKKLQQQGFTFGAHSINHPLYADLSLEEQLEQTNKSVLWLQDNVAIKHAVFAFPFNDVSVSKTFYQTAKLDLSFGTSGLKKDLITTNLQRLDMEKSVKTKSFLTKMYLKQFLKIAFGKNTMQRN